MVARMQTTLAQFAETPEQLRDLLTARGGREEKRRRLGGPRFP